MIRAGILGPSGYTGFHAIDILLRHPAVEIVYLGSRREERPLISDIWPRLRGRTDLRCSLLGVDPVPRMDVAIIALPHTVAMEHVPGLLERGTRVVDISADYRLREPAEYKRWYKKEHSDPVNLARAVYGLCECYSDRIARAVLVANPGCYPTAVELALAPLLKNRLHDVRRPIIVDAKSGISGAGRSPAPHLHFPEANESVTAYKVGTHQHMGEMIQTLSDLAGCRVEMLFVPHLVPMDRGILATCYVPLSRPLQTAELQRIAADFYSGRRFARVHMDDRIANTKDVMGTNFADISFRVLGDTAVAISAIDNLIKGASGQAVQNMNIMFGLDETMGLL